MNKKAASYISKIDSALIGWNVALALFFILAISMAAGLQALGWHNSITGWLLFGISIITAIYIGTYAGIKSFKALKPKPLWVLSVILFFLLAISWFTLPKPYVFLM